MAGPTVSVVTPSYNQARFLEETLQSVINQDYGDIEHVVVDGGSTDGSLDILKAYDDHVRWTSGPDEGQADAINKGFERVSGDIIGWLNSDDVYFDTGVVSRIVDYFEDTDADVLYGDTAVLDADSDVLCLRLLPDMDYSQLLRGCFIDQPAVFLKGRVLEDHRLNTELNYGMDYDFWLRLAREYEFRHVSDLLAGDRNHAERKILKDRAETVAESKKIRKRYGADLNALRYGRLKDKLLSGVPRGLRTLVRVQQLHGEELELAFDGELRPLPEMLLNTFRPSRNLV